MNIKACVRSMRLRTLPLSLSGIVLGCFLAASDYRFSPLVVVLLALTAVFLQILSNLSNELGDYRHGTDTEDRQGIHYSLQDGGLSERQMKRMILVFATLSCLSGLLMLKVSFGTLLSLLPMLFILLGACAVWAAMHYTLGENPYGYRGLGDIFVFIFFGLVTVLGSYFICAHEIPDWSLMLPACTIGCFSVAVLNVNNIRDMKTDAATRVTMALRLGPKRARIYQTVLIVLGWVFMVGFCCLNIFSIWHYLFVLALPAYWIHLKMVWTRADRGLDPALPLLVMGTFTFAALAGFGFVAFLL